MPAQSSIACAACAPVNPRAVRTREYLLKADFMRQLAHSDSARAGPMKRKYMGSKYIADDTSTVENEPTHQEYFPFPASRVSAGMRTAPRAARARLRCVLPRDDVAV